MSLNRAPWAELDALTAYHLLALRSKVFVVEQECAYLDPDGRDLDPDAEHWWATGPGGIQACLRVVPEAAGVRRIGRVVTTPEARGRGIAGDLVRGVVEAYPDDELVMSAQQHLAPWYAGFGFRPEGEAYAEDGILHVAMRRRGREVAVSAP